jgi:ABC-type branched-subunit amino acid transport system substrate-binding protein
VVTAAVATLATACGAASTSTTGGATVPSCATPGFAGKTIKLGFIYPDSGPLSSAFGAAKAGFIARIDQQNASGGVHGRQLVYDWQDDQGDLGQNKQATEQLIHDDVFGIVESTIATTGGADLMRAADVPVVGLPAEPVWANHAYPNMFAHAYVYGTSGSTTVFGDFLKAQHVTSVAIIGSDVAAASNGLDAEMAESFRYDGIAVSPGIFIFNEAHTDPRTLGQQLKRAGVDAVAGAIGAADTSAVMKGAREAGAPIKVFLSASGYDTSVLQREGQTMAGLATFLNYVPLEAGSPADQTYLDAMREYVPELQQPDQELALLAYISTDELLTGLEDGPACPTRASYITLMRNLTNYTAGGLLPGPVNMKDWGHINNCYTFVQVNQAGTAYDIMRDPGGNPQWCGTPIP